MATQLRPGLRAYAACSAAALAVAAYSALRRQPNGQTPASGAAAMAAHLLRDQRCVWVCLALVGSRRCLRALLGDVTPGEAGRARDALATFAFHNVCVLFGVFDVQNAQQLMLWTAWYIVLGACSALVVLATARMQGGSDGNGDGNGNGDGDGDGSWVDGSGDGGGVGVACGALALCGAAGAAALLGGTAAVVLTLLALLEGDERTDTQHTALLVLAAECAVVMLSGVRVWAEGRWGRHHRTTVGIHTLCVCVESCHVVHVCWLTCLRVSVAWSLPVLVLVLRLRRLLGHLAHSIGRMQRRRHLHRHVRDTYRLATPEEMKRHGDQCAICWEPLATARRLPCNHLFHSGCLCRWVCQHASCPTCRRPLTLPLPLSLPHTQTPAPANHLFHFDGSRYVSWLPSFSVEVTRAPAPPAAVMEHMARQVQALFPAVGLAVVRADLLVTLSPHLTIDNILEGRLSATPPTPALSPGAGEGEGVAPAMPSPPPPTAPPLARVGLPDPEPDHNDDHDHDQQRVEQPSPLEFSLEPEQRQSQLQRRKRAMVEAARQRYLARHPNS